MVTKRFTVRAVAGLSLLAGFGGAARAELPPITALDAFKVAPRQPGVNVSTPTPDQVPNCKVVPIPSQKDPKATVGYVVRDPAGKPVRQFVSLDGKTFNILVFFVDGIEAYREVYPPQDDQPFQFRWLGPNGTKWGVDKNRDGRIDEWAVISPEELSQELLQAVLTKDEKRAAALVVTKAHLDSIGVAGQKAQDILGRAAGATKRVGEAATALKATAEAKWGHIELGVPQSTAADAIGASDDLIVHKTGTVLVQDGKEAKFLQTGELVLVHRAWRLVDGPSAGFGSGNGPGPQVIPDAIRDLLGTLDKIDQTPPAQPVTRESLAAHNARRADVLEQIVAKLDPKDQESWVKQLVESLSAAAEGEKLDGKSLTRLKQYKEALAKGTNPNLAAFASFRYLLAENSINLANAPQGQLQVVQEKWRTNLEDFIKANPSADDTAEAMLRLAMAYEFLGKEKDGEAKAKEWYTNLSRKAEKNPHAAKGAGALRRMESEGKPLELSGPHLERPSELFNVTGLKDKVVVVYYCASWSSTLADDAKKLNALVKEYGPKGLELVTVCLDNDAKVALDAVSNAKLPGAKLHAAGGLDGSPLAAHYGIIVVPHIFVAGKDGKVVNRNGQAATIEDDVKKLLP